MPEEEPIVCRCVKCGVTCHGITLAYMEAQMCPKCYKESFPEEQPR